MRINTKALLAELSWVNRFIETKTTIPILLNASFVCSAGEITITGTDLEVAGITSLDGVGSDKWTVTAPVVKLIKYLGKIEDEEVEVSTDDRNCLIVKSVAGRSATNGMSVESFPELPTTPSPTFSITNLQQAADRVLFAVSGEESRFTLNGGCLEIDAEGARIIATDGHRLSLAPVKIGIGWNPAPVKVLIRKFALFEASRLDGDCIFAINSDHIWMSMGRRTILARKLTGNFPDYRRAMRDDMEFRVAIPVKSTMKSLDRVTCFADERTHSVHFRINEGLLIMSANTADTGECEERVPVRAGDVAVDHGQSFNAHYVTQFLQKVEAQFVSFCFQAKEYREIKGKKTDTGKMAQLVTADGWIYTVMPMRDGF